MPWKSVPKAADSQFFTSAPEIFPPKPIVLCPFKLIDIQMRQKRTLDAGAPSERLIDGRGGGRLSLRGMRHLVACDRCAGGAFDGTRQFHKPQSLWLKSSLLARADTVFFSNQAPHLRSSEPMRVIKKHLAVVEDAPS